MAHTSLSSPLWGAIHGGKGNLYVECFDRLRLLENRSRKQRASPIPLRFHQGQTLASFIQRCKFMATIGGGIRRMLERLVSAKTRTSHYLAPSLFSATTHTRTIYPSPYGFHLAAKSFGNLFFTLLCQVNVIRSESFYRLVYSQKQEGYRMRSPITAGASTSDDGTSTTSMMTA